MSGRDWLIALAAAIALDLADYGPVCADRFGLPWGVTSAPPIAVTVDGPPLVTDPGHPGFRGTTDEYPAAKAAA